MRQGAIFWFARRIRATFLLIFKNLEKWACHEAKISFSLISRKVSILRHIMFYKSYINTWPLRSYDFMLCAKGRGQLGVFPSQARLAPGLNLFYGP